MFLKKGPWVNQMDSGLETIGFPSLVFLKLGFPGSSVTSPGEVHTQAPAWTYRMWKCMFYQAMHVAPMAVEV